MTSHAMTRGAARQRAEHAVAETEMPPEAAPARTGLRWYHLATIYFLCQSMGAFTILDRLAYGEWAGKPGDKLTQLLNLMQIIAGFALFWRSRQRVRGISTGEVIVILLSLFLLSSCLWSIDPATTIRRGVLYVCFVVGVIGIAGSLDDDTYMRLLRNTCFVAGLISVALLAVVPHDVLMPAGTLEEGELRGIFPHKNLLGEVMAVGVLSALHGLRTEGQRRWRSMLALMMFAGLLLAARSGTAITASLALVAADALASLLRRGGAARMMGFGLILISVPIVLVMVLFPDLLLGLLGKDPTLTGRTILWQYVVFYIGEKPLLGWGLTAFWSPINPAYTEIANAVGWTVPEAHNGLLEMLLEVGVVGSLLLISVWLRNIVLAARCLGTPASNIGLSALLCYGVLVLFGISEQVLVDPDHIFVNLFFVTGLMCERAVATVSGALPAGTGMQASWPASPTLPPALSRRSTRA